MIISSPYWFLVLTWFDSGSELIVGLLGAGNGLGTGGAGAFWWYWGAGFKTLVSVTPAPSGCDLKIYKWIEGMTLYSVIVDTKFLILKLVVFKGIIHKSDL